MFDLVGFVSLMTCLLAVLFGTFCYFCPFLVPLPQRFKGIVYQLYF